MTQQILPSRKRANKKNQYRPTVTVKDTYRFYTSRYGQKERTGVSLRTFGKVLKEFNKYFADQLILGNRMILPYGLGTLEIMKRKQAYLIIDGKLQTKRLLIDWPSTWEYWKTNQKAKESKKLLYYTNEHSDNYRYKFVWDKYGAKCRGLCYYSFDASRLLSRRLKEYILDPDTPKNYTTKC